MTAYLEDDARVSTNSNFPDGNLLHASVRRPPTVRFAPSSHSRAAD